MNELYISRKAVMLALMREADTHLNPVKRAYARAAAIVEQIAVADVQPVKRGLWENTNTPNQLRCSVCEIVHFIAQYPHGDINYCPNCGARMK